MVSADVLGEDQVESPLDAGNPKVRCGVRVGRYRGARVCTCFDREADRRVGRRRFCGCPVFSSGCAKYSDACRESRGCAVRSLDDSACLFEHSLVYGLARRQAASHRVCARRAQAETSSGSIHEGAEPVARIKGTLDHILQLPHVARPVGRRRDARGNSLFHLFSIPVCRSAGRYLPRQKMGSS